MKKGERRLKLLGEDEDLSQLIWDRVDLEVMSAKN
ncbi:hypothetical protein CCACVL1_30277 [Corchorus capsularis]|uniref:Uncharacterized protein n=1 Tax=Corchorus capsularis TaxID=210143 RepID=A0A1R3FY35_COCAP|nr:hypothetical protein CCACVL1_30277 [Corchorus capsularis]